jgi:hypothetical protein
MHRSQETKGLGLVEGVLGKAGVHEFCSDHPQQLLPPSFAPEAFEPWFRLCHRQDLRL